MFHNFVGNNLFTGQTINSRQDRHHSDFSSKQDLQLLFRYTRCSISNSYKYVIVEHI